MDNAITQTQAKIVYLVDKRLNCTLAFFKAAGLIFLLCTDALHKAKTAPARELPVAFNSVPALRQVKDAVYPFLDLGVDG